ncbi:hypothetical protein FQR65_LT03154 [Abscondita terminalis]|nr:hypothetical protein FQR65_LT03154 [Abscondita terminalis]
MRTFFFTCLIAIIIRITISENTYRAAVVEYATKTDGLTNSTSMLQNVQEYIKYIKEASDDGADIIVFPEYALTGEEITAHNINQLGIEVPDPKLKISLCDSNNSNLSKVLVDLSCAATTYRIYVVANIVEKRNASYYNTNIVFNRNGVLITRFSKINLYMEASVLPGDEVVTFETDFGVTFGMFICSDILFKKPALDVVSNLSVTDIIFSTAWATELPLIDSLSLVQGYAKSMGVNVLVSQLNNPAKSNSGSGIFSANGKILSIYKSTERSSKMLITSVPKIRRPNTINHPDQVVVDSTDFAKYQSSLSNFITLQQDLANYTFKAINLSDTTVTEKICVGAKKQFCCSIDLTLRVHNSPNYCYKYIVFLYIFIVKLTNLFTQIGCI